MRVDVWFDPLAQERVQPLLSALGGAGVDAVYAGAEPGSGTLVVLITESAMQPPLAEMLTELATSYLDLVPVSFLDGAAPLFAELSQSIVKQLGTAECARRIAAIARHGGRSIVAWNDLVARAQKWQGTESQELLPEKAIRDARALLRTGLAAESVSRAVVNGYVAASAAAVGRRKRIGTAVLSSAAVALAGLLAFSTVQAVSANSARERAIDSAHRTTANRLGQQAAEGVAGNPDLPTILADRAMSAASTSASVSAVFVAASHTWPHKSIALGYQPMNVAAARKADVIAVTDAQNKQIVVYTDHGSARLGAVSYGGFGTGAVSRISPNGKRIAVESTKPGSLSFYSARGEPQSASWVAPDDHLIGWADDDHVLTYRSREVLLMDVETGAVDTVGPLPSGEKVTDANLSIDARFVAVAGEHSVSVLDVDRHRVSFTSPIALSQPIITGGGRYLFGIEGVQPISLDLKAADPLAKKLSYECAASRVTESTGSYVVATGTDGHMCLLVLGEQKPVQTVIAHLSDSVRPARLENDQLATVGIDGYLRIWDVPDSRILGYPVSKLGAVDANRVMVVTALGTRLRTRLSVRNQIRTTPDGKIAAVIMPGYATVVDGVGPEQGPHKAFFGVRSDVVLSDDEARIAVVGPESRVGAYDPKLHRWTPQHTLSGQTPQMAVATGNDGVAALSNSGDTIAVADARSVGSLTESGGEHAEFDSASEPVAIYAADGSAVVVTATGILRRSNGTETPLRVAGQKSPPRIATGAFASPSDALLVADNGDVLRLNGDKLEPIRSLHASTGAFAVRVSKDGAWIAVVGDSGYQVFDRRSGRTIYAEPSHGRYLVTDVDLDPRRGSIVSINSLSLIHEVHVSEVRDGGRPQLPRKATNVEAQLYHLDG